MNEGLAWGLIEFVIAGLGVGFGLGGLARIRAKGERGPGDRLTCWGLIGTGTLLMIHGLAWMAGLV